jgi:hypothetical protein
MAEPPSSPMAAWGLRLVNRVYCRLSPLWLGLLSGSTLFSPFREDHAHAHDTKLPPPPRLLPLSKTITRDTCSSVRKRHPSIEPGYLLPRLTTVQGYPEAFPTTAARSTRVRVPLQDNAVS